MENETWYDWVACSKSQEEVGLESEGRQWPMCYLASNMSPSLFLFKGLLILDLVVVHEKGPLDSNIVPSWGSPIGPQDHDPHRTKVIPSAMADLST